MSSTGLSSPFPYRHFPSSLHSVPDTGTRIARSHSIRIGGTHQ
jgi:hypothetical protein